MAMPPMESALDDLDLDEGVEAEESSIDDSNPSATPAPAHEPEPPAAAEDRDEDYSKRVRKRIGEEVYRRKVAEEREARLASDLAALRADLEQFKTRQATAETQAVEGSLREKLQSARTRLKDAEESGDIDKKLEILDEYDDLRQQQRKLTESRQVAAAPPAAPPSSPSAPPARSPLPTGTEQWLAKNPWYLTGSHPDAAQLAMQLDVVLQQEGFLPTDPAMYAEMNRRLKVAMPKIAPLLGEVKSKTRDAGPPSGANSADGLGEPTTRRTLTRDDLTEMAAYGLNPNSKEDRRAWLRTHQQPQ